MWSRCLKNRYAQYYYYFNQIKDKAECAYFFHLPYGLNRWFNFIPTMEELKVKPMRAAAGQADLFGKFGKVSIAAF